MILPSHAHKPSDSYLTLTINGNTIDGQWDIALRDLDFAIGLDTDGNGEIVWDEVRARHPEIAAYALSRLNLSNKDGPCQAKPVQHLIDDHSDGAYAVLLFRADCAHQVESLTVQYSLFADLDPQHKGLLRLEGNGQTITAIFGPDNPRQVFRSSEQTRLRQFADYVQHGIWHIWIGFDHILFLLSLLFPAVLSFNGKTWQPAESFKASFLDVFKIVTAFTLAHSITLTLATLQFISLPSRWIESAIALSVVIAALNNVFPLFQGSRWIAAFVFGLIHGFGFASVLGDLGLPQNALLLALVGFNVGVEIGQLAIVAAFLPIAYALRQTWFYRGVILGTGSTLIAAIAAIWLVERVFDLRLISS
ncbi:HupE/UreJ family protein [Noviherbaspirillum cavernae]|uniref:HupE/UreJ family protein n=1 Tax=Noviherbaspirillum cavernae TaxID=2320862 RepID=UPI0030F3CEC1